MVEHKLRRVHNWIMGKDGYACSTGPSSFTRADAEKNCSGCGATVPYDVALEMAAAKNFGNYSSWVIDKAYHDVVDPCGCARCEARRANNRADNRKTITISSADIFTIDAAELLGKKKTK